VSEDAKTPLTAWSFKHLQHGDCRYTADEGFRVKARKRAADRAPILLGSRVTESLCMSTT